MLDPWLPTPPACWTPTYAEPGVRWSWSVDGGARTVEAFAHAAGAFRSVGTWRGDEPARFAPFDAVDIALADPWAW